MMARQTLLTEREPESSQKRPRLDQDDSIDTASRYEPYTLSSEAHLDSLSQPYDIGSIAELVARLTREEKFQALNNLYKPSSRYVFPQHTEGLGNHKRSFQYKWLNEYAWLTYSKEKDGGYCVPCAFFCKGDEGLGKLVNTPLTKFKDAMDIFRQHTKKAYHCHSVADMLTFMRIMNNEQVPIDHQLVSSMGKRTVKY